MKILILTSSTGSGHNMRARALAQWAARDRADSWQVVIHEALESTHPLYRLGVETYNVIQRRAPWAHHLYFNYLEAAAMHRRADRILGRDAFIALVQREAPDVVVSVHGHTNHGFFDLARRAIPQRPPICLTYCGELFGGYGLSRHWINPEADGFIGAVPELCDAARKDHHMPAAKTYCGGFLLRPPFYDRPPDDPGQVLVECGLDPRTFTLLLSTGDAGANNHLVFLNALERARLPIQVVALCGRQESTRREVEAWSDARPEAGRSVRVVALGYREDMHILMRAVSAVVARPGTGATSEALLTRCPIIHNGMGGIMPQEWITVKFCRQHGIDLVARHPRQLVERVRFLLEDTSRVPALREAMKRATPPGSPADILEWIESVADQAKSRTH